MCGSGSRLKDWETLKKSSINGNKKFLIPFYASLHTGYYLFENSENYFENYLVPSRRFNSFGTGGFIFADQFLQISTRLATSNVYGLGEHRTNLRLNTNWQSLTIFNKDQPPTENANLYGSHPFYLVMEESGNCHGVLFLNSNAMGKPRKNLIFLFIMIFLICLQINSVPFFAFKSDKKGTELISRPNIFVFWY